MEVWRVKREGRRGGERQGETFRGEGWKKMSRTSGWRGCDGNNFGDDMVTYSEDVCVYTEERGGGGSESTYSRRRRIGVQSLTFGAVRSLQALALGWRFS